MRGTASHQEMMSCYLSPESRVPTTHPLRRLQPMADAVMQALSSVFEKMYSNTGRSLIPPERPLKAQGLLAFYSVRSGRLFCERLDYDILFRCFLDMHLEDPPFNHSTFSKNSQRLLVHAMAKWFFNAMVRYASLMPAVGRALCGGRDPDRGLASPQKPEADRSLQAAAFDG